MKVCIDSSIPKGNRIVSNVLAAIGEDSITWFDGEIKKHQEETLIIKQGQGKALKECPCTNHYRGCDYQVLHFGDNCPYECTYCILNAYFDSEDNVVYADVDSMVDECIEYLNDHDYLRLGTGEFTDSMIYESITGFSRDFTDTLYNRLEKQGIATNRVSVELKTKSLNVDSMKGSKYASNIVLAWSVNADTIQKGDELKTPSIQDRLKKAGEMASLGFKTAFHFDPIILFDNWKIEYEACVDSIFTNVPEKSIAFISLGSFRYMPNLERFMLKKYAYSRIMEQEFIRAVDGKMRYPYPVRRDMFKAVYNRIRTYSHDLAVYFCMEGERTWIDVIDFHPESDEALGKMLWDSIFRDEP